MTKFLHTADWQIGRLYGSFDPDDAVTLADARFAAIERLARLAAEERVDAVLVAGDVFDAQTVSARTIRRLFNALEPYPGPWVMIPGNHDAALAEGVWSYAKRLDALPANLHLALEPQVFELPEQRIVVLCAPLTQRHTYGDLTDWFDARETPLGWLRVGVSHGAVQGLLSEDIDSANPIAPDRAQRARLDYLALGDWHGTKRIRSHLVQRHAGARSLQGQRLRAGAPGGDRSAGRAAASPRRRIAIAARWRGGWRCTSDRP